MKADPRVQARFIQYAGQLHLSVVSLGELLAWTSRPKAPPRRLQTLVDLLKEVAVLHSMSQWPASLEKCELGNWTTDSSAQISIYSTAPSL
jgi:hypothetical protein